MSKNREYAEKYAEYAKEQMIKYGIPASVTLAQGILESSNGESELAKKGNAHFGIKCTKDWLENGGSYLIYTDDRPDEKFCTYNSVAESYEHHSEFLKNNARYRECFALEVGDYKGWCDGLEKAGYASGKGYSDILKRIIETNGLDKYDHEAIKAKEIQENTSEKTEEKEKQGKEYSFPIERKDFLLVTSPFGVRENPINRKEEEMHNGLDIKTNSDYVMATENGGKITGINENPKSEEGKSVTIAYERKDGGRTEITYMHLDNINVKVGDEVSAGQKIGSSGENLHMNVKQTGTDGRSRNVDPAAYLSEIAEKGDIRTALMYNGENLLEKYSNTETMRTETHLSPEEWMKKLLSSEDSGIGMGSDPLMQMIMLLYTGLMTMANQLDNKNKSREEKMEAVTQAVTEKRIDISKMIPQSNKSELTTDKNGKTTLTAEIGGETIRHELSKSEINALTKCLASNGMTETEKAKYINATLGQILATKQAGMNFEQEMQRNAGIGEQIKM